jgi:hypothetical protein
MLYRKDSVKKCISNKIDGVMDCIDILYLMKYSVAVICNEQLPVHGRNV